MPVAGQSRYPQLMDREWLRSRLDADLSMAAIAAEVGCGEKAVAAAVKRLDLEAHCRTKRGRYGEPLPQRRFKPLADKLDLPSDEFELDVDVAADELARRLSEGLVDFAALVRLAAELPRERFWSLVVDQVDAPTARVCTFMAACLAAEQARRVPQTA